MTGTFSRREILQAAAAGVLAPSLARARSPEPGSGQRIVVKETAGLRRFGYPVRVEFPAQGRDPQKLQLQVLGKPQQAQFRPVPGKPDQITLEFNSSPGPFGSLEYEICEGSPNEGRGGMTAEVRDGTVIVANGRALRYELSANLQGFLHQVTNGKDDYLAPGSTGLVLQDQERKSVPVGGGGTTRTLLRQGPLAVGLRYETRTRLTDGGVASSVIDLTFPNSKSWVEAVWTISGAKVAQMGLDLNLQVGKGTTLADFGATSTVYTQILESERCVFQSGPNGDRSWEIRRGRPDALPLFAGSTKGDTRPVEGWAHVMDSARCTAVSVADFGKTGKDRIVVDANGRLQVWRDASASKTLRFWLHFVPMPVQVGAVTSPQAMLAPLEVEFLK